MNRYIVIGFFLTLFAMGTFSPAAPVANSPWPCMGASAQHTARSTAAVLPPNVRTNLYWLGVACVVTLPTNATTGGVVVDGSGNLFVGCGSNLLSYAVQGTTNLTLRWNYVPNTNLFVCVPAVDNAGACYAASVAYPNNGQTQAKLLKVNADGTLAWTTANIGAYYYINVRSPTILADGTIVFGRGSGGLPNYVRFNDDGTYPATYQYSTLWTNGTSTCINAVSQGVGAYTNRLYAHGSYYSQFKAVAYAYELDSGGATSTVIWRYVPPNNQGSTATPIVGTNNMLYCVDQYYVRKLDGTLNGGGEIAAVWETNVQYIGATYTWYGALSADETTLYLSTDSGAKFGALNTSDGSLKWKLNLPKASSAPAIDSSGYIYFTTTNFLYCVQDTGTAARIVQTLDLSAYATSFQAHPCLVDCGIYLLGGDKLIWIRRQELPSGTIFTVR